MLLVAGAVIQLIIVNNRSRVAQPINIRSPLGAATIIVIALS